MKKYCLYAVAAMLVMVVAPVLAQEDEGMMQMPRFSVNVAEHVKPGMMDEYVEATKKWIEMIKGEGMNMMFFGFADRASNMHYAVPINSMAEIDSKAQEWGKAVGMMRGTDWGAIRQKCIEWTQYTIWMWAQDASYMPAEPELSDMEMLYMKWADIRVSHQNEAKFVELLGKIKAVYAKHNIGRSYNVYRNIIGLPGGAEKTPLMSSTPAWPAGRKWARNSKRSWIKRWTSPRRSPKAKAGPART